MSDSLPSKSIASLIDHALLHPTLTDEQIREGCRLADQLNVASVCVKPYAIPLAVSVLKDSNVAVGTVIGFPHGSQPPEVKAAEALWCCRAGASELDMVINIGKAVQGDWDYVRSDVEAVVAVGKQFKAIVKVIFETDYIGDEVTIRKLCQLSHTAGADFVKTSTGFGFNKRPNGDYNYVGATQEHIYWMVESCPESMQVKASGGIRGFEDAERFRKIGATRLGTSASEVIISGEGQDNTGY